MLPSFPVTATLAGSGRRGFVDGPRISQAYLNEPLELCALGAGFPNLFAVADSRNGCLRVLDVGSGTLHTLATHGAAFLGPRGPLVVDGALAVADSGHNKVRMLRLERRAGGGCPVACAKDSALAGSGKAGCADGPAEAATFHGPTGLALLPDGSLAVADTGSHAVRRIAARPGARGFFVTTLAGGGGPGFADGKGRGSSALRGPTALAVCPATGTLVVADTGNHAVRALHPPPGGPAGGGDGGGGGGWVLTTLAGDGTPGFSDGGGGRLREPSGLAFAEDGALLIADTGNNCVRALGAGGAGDGRAALLTLDWAAPDALRGGGARAALLLARAGTVERTLVLPEGFAATAAAGRGARQRRRWRRPFLRRPRAPRCCPRWALAWARRCLAWCSTARLRRSPPCTRGFPPSPRLRGARPQRCCAHPAAARAGAAVAAATRRWWRRLRARRAQRTASAARRPRSGAPAASA